MKKPKNTNPLQINSSDEAFSVNRLSTLIGCDRRTIHKAVIGLQPAKVEGKTKFYTLDAVKAALKEKPEKGLKDKLLSQQIRKLEISNEKASGALVLKSKIVAFFYGFITESRAALHQVLENEYPTAVAGMDPPQARILGKRLADKLDDIARRHGTKLEELK